MIYNEPTFNRILSEQQHINPKYCFDVLIHRKYFGCR